jgi:hypothetical protein
VHGARVLLMPETGGGSGGRGFAVTQRSNLKAHPKVQLNFLWPTFPYLPEQLFDLALNR